MAKPFRYNAYFELNGDRFEVNMEEFSYSWSLVSKGSSQARQAYTIYPNRVEQSPLSVTLVFRDPDEYRRFGNWCMEYQRYVTAVSTPANLTFVSGAIRGGIKYSVALTDVPMTFDYKMVAPRMRLTMRILKDEMDTGDVSGSDITGDASDLAGDSLVNATDIKNHGEDAYKTGADRYKQ